MARFNPFNRRDSRYGAPMGRHGDSPEAWDGRGRLYARHMGGDGFYDRGGVYWGHSRTWAVWSRGGAFCAYVEATSSAGAVATVQSLSAEA